MNTTRIQQIRQLLETALQPSVLEIIDESHKHIGHIGAQSGAGHFALIISSTHFNDKKPLDCHRMIYAVLTNMMQTDIHALKIKIV